MSDLFLIVGLGNPGPQYEKTRHNVGFMALEAFAQRHGIADKAEKRFQARVGIGRYGEKRLILAKPSTFMNLSGQAVVSLLKFYQLEPSQLLVVYDDAALPFGKIRLRPDGSAAGQKGVQSIIDQLGGNKSFPRLRIGIGSPPPEMAMTDYVLGAFRLEEKKILAERMATIMDAIESWLDKGIEAAMTQYNGLSP